MCSYHGCRVETTALPQLRKPEVQKYWDGFEARFEVN